MEIRQLKYFLAVADQRSFVNAANVLFISRQAVSKAIAQLETELNVELFMVRLARKPGVPAKEKEREP